MLRRLTFILLVSLSALGQNPCVEKAKDCKPPIGKSRHYEEQHCTCVICANGTPNQKMVCMDDKEVSLLTTQTRGSENQIVLQHSTTGTEGIRGTVRDSSGTVVPDASVTITSSTHGVSRTIETDKDGAYEFALLLPGHYVIQTAHPGYQTVKQEVDLGGEQRAVVDSRLEIGRTETVEVVTTAPILQTDTSLLGDIIDSKSAQGVNDSDRLSALSVKETLQSGTYGANGRGNSVTVDGGDANNDSGGLRPTLSRDAVEVFQVNSSNYRADVGGASGGSINIVSKAGSNARHGSASGFFRNDAMDASNPFAFTPALAPGQAFNPALPDLHGTPTKDSLTREQFGGSFGFPIKRDKTFAFVAAEGLIQSAQNPVSLLTSTSVFRPDTGAFSGNEQTPILSGLAALGATPVPCRNGQPLIPAAVCAGILNNILTVNPGASPFSAFLVNEFESNGGLFKYENREYFISGRVDQVFNDTNRAYLRYSFAHDNEQSPDVQSLVGFSAGSFIHTYDNTAQASWFHQFSQKTQNELRGQFNYSNFKVIPNEPGQVGLAIPGFANLGTNIFLPRLTILRRPEFADNLTMIRRSHTINWGAYFLDRGNHAESHSFFPGRFVFGNMPGGVLSPCLQTPGTCGLVAAPLASCLPVNGVFPTPRPGQFCFPAAINGLQSASLGLPQFYQQGFGNPTYNSARPISAFYWQDNWRATSNFTLTYGIRYELDVQSGQLNTDKDNFAPRLSFDWDPFKNHKLEIRGGAGIYYSPISGEILNGVQTLGLVNGVRPIAQVFVPFPGAPGLVPPNPGLTSSAIFQTLFAQGLIQCTTPASGQAACITPANLAQFGSPLNNIVNTGPAPPLSVLFSGQPDFQNPYSTQVSFGIKGEVSKGLTIALNGVYEHTLRLPVTLDVNLLPTAPVSTGVSPFTGQQVQFQNWGAPQCGASPFLCFANPLLMQGNQYSSRASALYEGATLEIRQRSSQHLTLVGSYTLSKAYDTSSDFNSDFAPSNQLNLAGERGLSDFDQRHTIIVAGIFASPGNSIAWGGWQLEPTIRYSSGHPVNILAAGTDINGDRHYTNDRPLGISRNTGLGPNYFGLDLRLTKALKLNEREQFQLIAEGFNVFNRSNFASVNNQAATINGFTDLAAASHGAFRNPAAVNPGGTPLAFTSALPKRQLQLGLRFTF